MKIFALAACLIVGMTPLQAQSCFVFLSAESKQPHVSDPSECAHATAPASTFKIPHALIALQAGVVTPQYVFRWDGTPLANESWQRDHTLASAIQWSVLPFFQRTAKLLGPERMREGLKSLAYANDTFAGDVSQFWVNGDLLVTPMEQLAFLQRFFSGTLPVSPAHIATVKSAMRMPPGVVLNALGPQPFQPGWPAHAVVYSKTRHTLVNGEQVNWLIGAISLDRAVHLFVARVRGTDVSRTAAIELAAAGLRGNNRREMNDVQH
jgi:beta-lactamase class D